MKYRDENGVFQDLYLPPTGDTLPIGSEVDYDGTEVPYGWEETTGESLIAYTLYESSSGTAEDVTLSDSAVNYDYIEMFYAKGDGGWSSIKISEPNGKSTTLYSPNAYNNANIQEIWKYVTISGDTIVSNYGLIRNNTGAIQQENLMKIYKVVGYKEV